MRSRRQSRKWPDPERLAASVADLLSAAQDGQEADRVVKFIQRLMRFSRHTPPGKQMEINTDTTAPERGRERCRIYIYIYIPISSYIYCIQLVLEMNSLQSNVLLASPFLTETLCQVAGATWAARVTGSCISTSKGAASSNFHSSTNASWASERWGCLILGCHPL